MAVSTRRRLLAGTAAILGSRAAFGHSIVGKLPWRPDEVYPPEAVRPGPLGFFTPAEAALVDAIVDRLIPPDAQGPGGKEAGCTVFIDRQLQGPFGGSDWLYMQAPFSDTALPGQGLQTPLVPRMQYRLALAALDAHCRTGLAGRSFAELAPADQDTLLGSMEQGELLLQGIDAKLFFGTILANTIEGFFADPIYGGNRGMAGWKLIGFPGARYDFRDVMQRPNQVYALPPVGLQGRPAWNGEPPSGAPG